MISTYVLPIIVVSLCYSLIGKALCSSEFHRNTSNSSSTVMLGRKRVARMLIVLIGVFLVCWLPYNICSLSLDLKLNFRDTLVLPFTVWVGHAHSAINPVLYWFLNKNFRHCMRKVLRCTYVIHTNTKHSPSPQYVWCMYRNSPCISLVKRDQELLWWIVTYHHDCMVYSM